MVAVIVVVVVTVTIIKMITIQLSMRSMIAATFDDAAARSMPVQT